MVLGWGEKRDRKRTRSLPNSSPSQTLIPIAPRHFHGSSKPIFHIGFILGALGFGFAAKSTQKCRKMESNGVMVTRQESNRWSNLSRKAQIDG
ncbi:hypothetical protein HanPI659440_Chr11g0440891 [Helianthus annuus]|nr:hypothetical protein HanPI659440_Chr11g0440891 [Helianthus annuus]